MISIFKNINQFAGSWKALDLFAVFCAKYLLYLMFIFLLCFTLIKHDWHLFFFPLLSSLFAAFVIDTVIYVFYKKRRPAEMRSAKVLIGVPSNPSFPSRHASLVFGLSFCLFFFDAALATIFIICSCLVGIARVFCGVHWFRDIAAGALTGFISSWVIYFLTV